MWWKECIGYQIYLRSFYDSNNDGIGDLKGVIKKLDYLKGLGVNLLWISPFYESPNDDNGYDISNYFKISKEFGTMEDFHALLKKAHSFNIKIIIDLVINHTSDEHPWFIESKSSLNNNKRDWYIWSKKPNNWESIFKGSAWEKESLTKEYYLHLFSKKQPDLNWENKEVRKALYKMINWWLDKGIDGFRVDAITHIKKRKNLPNMPNKTDNAYIPAFNKFTNVYGIHSFLKELKKNTFDKYNIVTVGEANGVGLKDIYKWVDERDGRFNMIFQFEHLNLWSFEKNISFSPKKYKDISNKWQNILAKKGWNALFIENHDIPRSTSTWGNDKDYWMESAKSFALAYFMQKGTPFIYQGQEIGMTNSVFSSLDDFQDVRSINEAKDYFKKGLSSNEILNILSNTSRDNARTPMQWDNSTYSGFSSHKPWLKINDNFKKINVKKQILEKNSILNFYKNLIQLKKSNKTLIYGDFNLIFENDSNIFAYTRSLNNEFFLIICNLTSFSHTISTHKFSNIPISILISNYSIKEINLKKIILNPYECILCKFYI